jgi:hypothetical protein
MPKWNEFDDREWDRIEETWCAWWEGELDRPLLFIESVPLESGVLVSNLTPHLTQYGLDTPVEEFMTQIEGCLRQVEYLGDAFPKWFPNLGAGVLAAFLGSQPHFDNDTTWFNPVDDREMANLETEIDPSNPWWVRLGEIMEAAKRLVQGNYVLGYTDIGGNLDTLASLWTSQRLLTDLLDEPEKIERWAKSVTQRWLEVYAKIEERMPARQNGRTGWAPLWAPGTTYMLQSDFCTMISPKMFQKYVLPDLQACCEAIDYPFFHLDGEGATRHLDALLSIEKLRGIQWVPGAGKPPAEDWLPLLKKIRDSGKKCQVYVTVEGALKITRALGGDGFAFYIGDRRLATPEEGWDCLKQFGRHRF